MTNFSEIERDIIPDNLEFIGITKSSMSYKILLKYYGFINKKMDLIIVPGLSMKKRLVHNCIDAGKVIVLPHGTDANRQQATEMDMIISKQYKLENKFIVLYSGSFNSYYDVINYINVARILELENNNVCFVLIGQGSDYEKAVNVVRKYRLQNVILTGSLDHEKIASFQRFVHIFLS